MMKMKKMLTDKFITDELCHYFCRMPGHRFGFHMEIYFDEMYVVFPLVVLCERRLHDTLPLFGPRGRHWEVVSR